VSRSSPFQPPSVYILPDRELPPMNPLFFFCFPFPSPKFAFSPQTMSGFRLFLACLFPKIARFFVFLSQFEECWFPPGSVSLKTRILWSLFFHSPLCFCPERMMPPIFFEFSSPALTGASSPVPGTFDHVSPGMTGDGAICPLFSFRSYVVGAELVHGVS